MSTNAPLPRFVDQTRALLWCQLMANMIGLLFFVALIVILQPPLETSDGWYIYPAILGLFVGGLLSAAAAKMFPRGWAFGWLVALLAQALVLIAGWCVWELGVIIGIPMIIALAGVVWIGVNLFRGQVLQFFFTRAAG
jgi:hypothetical protein